MLSFMGSFFKGVVFVLITIILLLIILVKGIEFNWVFNHKYLQPKVQEYVPIEIELRDELLSVGKNGWWGDGCWFIVHNLQRKSEEAVRSKGLNLLNEITPKYNANSSLSKRYQKWTAIPKDHDYLFLSGISGSECEDEHKDKLRYFFYKTIISEIQNGGVVYKTQRIHQGPAVNLFIIPRLGIIAYDYIGS